LVRSAREAGGIQQRTVRPWGSQDPTACAFRQTGVGCAGGGAQITSA
jgi:hypothetical protein